MEQKIHKSNLRLPEDIKAMLTNLAVKDGRSQNTVVMIAIREKYERDIEGKPNGT